MRALVFAAAMFATTSAWATPPQQAFYGFINNQSTAIYAGDSALGLCIQIETQVAPGSWQSIATMQCGITQTTLDQHGGARGLIEWLRPDINRVLTAYFGGGGDVAAQIDEALNQWFQFVGAQLVPKP